MAGKSSSPVPLWSAGPGGLIAREHVVAVGRWESAPIRRAAQQARKDGRLIDLTYGYACKSVVFMDSGHVVLAATSYFWPEPVPFQPTPDDERTLYGLRPGISSPKSPSSRPEKGDAA
jgi:regulator of extracellular matrix RemA (YlzA/DUF370 family)